MNKIKKILLFFLIINIMFTGIVHADNPAFYNIAQRIIGENDMVDFCKERGIPESTAKSFFDVASSGGTSADISKFVEVAYAKDSQFSSFANKSFFEGLIDHINEGENHSEDSIRELKGKVDDYREGLKNQNNTNDSDDWWASAYGFFNKASVNKSELPAITKITDLIKVIGNAVFIIVTIVLGLKYMYGSAEGKMSVKEGLISLTVAMVLFYGWGALENILYPGNQLIWVSNSDKATIGNVYATIVYFLNFIAIGGLIYVGIKFLLSGAEGKAELKGKGVPFAIGMVLTFSTLTFLNFMTKVIGEII